MTDEELGRTVRLTADMVHDLMSSVLGPVLVFALAVTYLPRLYEAVRLEWMRQQSDPWEALAEHIAETTSVSDEE